MKNISTEKLLVVYIACSTVLMIMLLWLTIGARQQIHSMQSTLDKVDFNAQQACVYATPDKVVSNCDTD